MEAASATIEIVAMKNAARPSICTFQFSTTIPIPGMLAVKVVPLSIVATLKAMPTSDASAAQACASVEPMRSFLRLAKARESTAPAPKKIIIASKPYCARISMALFCRAFFSQELHDLEHRGDHLFGRRRIAGDLDVDRYHVFHTSRDRIGTLEDPAVYRAVSHGDHDLRVGGRLVGTSQSFRHVTCHGARHEESVRMSRRGDELDAEALDVVVGISECYELQLFGIRRAGSHFTDRERTFERGKYGIPQLLSNFHGLSGCLEFTPRHHGFRRCQYLFEQSVHGGCVVKTKRPTRALCAKTGRSARLYTRCPKITIGACLQKIIAGSAWHCRRIA